MAQSNKKAADESSTPQPQAGTVISPGQTVDLHAVSGPPSPKAPPESPKKVESKPPEPASVPTEAVIPEPPKPVPTDVPAPVPAAEPMTTETEEPAAAENTISWTASEFVAHDKTAGWYALLLFGAALFSAIVYLVTKDVVSSGVVLAAAVILAVFAAHKPQEQQFMLDEQGITIGQKRYDYDDYKSFAVASEGAFSSLVFMPLKRFAIPLTIYYAPEDEERIINLLSERLPLEEHRLDAIDNLMRRMRF